jgi:hypothetical protein
MNKSCQERRRPGVLHGCSGVVSQGSAHGATRRICAFSCKPQRSKLLLIQLYTHNWQMMIVLPNALSVQYLLPAARKKKGRSLNMASWETVHCGKKKKRPSLYSKKKCNKPKQSVVSPKGRFYLLARSTPCTSLPGSGGDSDRETLPFTTEIATFNSGTWFF